MYSRYTNNNFVSIDTGIVLYSIAALALIFAAKNIIRKNEIKNNSLYFLAGTMVNVTYSIVVGIILKGLLGML